MSQQSRPPQSRATLTRGPLPASVYWRRRITVLVAVTTAVALAVGLVGGLARLTLGGGEDGRGQVALTGTQPTPDQPTDNQATDNQATGTAAEPTEGADEGPGRKTRSSKTRSKPSALPEPQGTCAEEDVVVKPRVEDAVAGRPVTVSLTLHTVLVEACTWELSRATFTWKITSGSDEIWTSRECPRSLPGHELVVRRDTTTTTELTWGGRRSDADCSRLTEWAMPGWYHVTVSPLAGEPKDAQFELRPATPATVTAAPSPTPEKRREKRSTKQRDGQRQ